jgi:hypothetical protein
MSYYGVSWNVTLQLRLVCRGSSAQRSSAQASSEVPVPVEGRGVYAQQHQSNNKPPDATASATASSPSSTVSQPVRAPALALLTSLLIYPIHVYMLNAN